ncbi:hypothetical protein L218DRAFT_945170 [Marasmius fiardii PR-910]|nr:hypothetical protein L218DRAFT_945170 [Marasmius fiardii PR-910]
MSPILNTTLGGKGPIQPHFTNLPRRRPKRMLTNASDATQAIQQRPLSSSSKNASERQTSSSSFSNKTNYLTTSQLPLLTPASYVPSGPSFNSTTTSSSQNNALSGFGPNENVITRSTSPSLPQSLSLALPKPKGHIQPHANNIPRRKRVQLNPEQLRRKLRQEWIACIHKEEVLIGSGVWVSFDLKDPEVCGLNKGEIELDKFDEGTRQELDEYVKETEKTYLQTFRHVVKVVASPAVGDATGIDESGQIVTLLISNDCRRDDGVPCVSTKQLSFVSRLVLNQYGSDTIEVPEERKERILITVPRARSADAIALAIIACQAAGVRSIPFTNTSIPLSRVHSRAPTRGSSPEPSSFHTEIPSFPPILPADPMTHAGALQSPALTLLARMYDLEDLDEAWKGALSVSGLERVNEVLETLEY